MYIIIIINNLYQLKENLTIQSFHSLTISNVIEFKMLLYIGKYYMVLC